MVWLLKDTSPRLTNLQLLVDSDHFQLPLWELSDSRAAEFRSTRGCARAATSHVLQGDFLAICTLQKGMCRIELGGITARPASRAHSCTFAMVQRPAPLVAAK